MREEARSVWSKTKGKCFESVIFMVISTCWWFSYATSINLPFSTAQSVLFSVFHHGIKTQSLEWSPGLNLVFLVFSLHLSSFSSSSEACH